MKQTTNETVVFLPSLFHSHYVETNPSTNETKLRFQYDCSLQNEKLCVTCIQ
jgi:hypothetical protein